MYSDICKLSYKLPESDHQVDEKSEEKYYATDTMIYFDSCQFTTPMWVTSCTYTTMKIHHRSKHKYIGFEMMGCNTMYFRKILMASFCLAYSATQKMEAICSSKTSGCFWNT
jgi:hypothetical protein